MTSAALTLQRHVLTGRWAIHIMTRCVLWRRRFLRICGGQRVTCMKGPPMWISEHAREEAFWSHIDDGAEEDDWFWDYFAHAERQWKE